MEAITETMTALADQHQPRRIMSKDGSGIACAGCRMAWPCRTIRLVREHEQALSRLAEAEPPQLFAVESKAVAKIPKRDEIWDALIAACEIAPGSITKGLRGAINRAAKELRAVNATPQTIYHVAACYRREMPDIPLTPNALAKHYARYVDQPIPRVRGKAGAAIDRAFGQ